jgi:spore coat protein U-like protein
MNHWINQKWSRRANGLCRRWALIKSALCLCVVAAMTNAGAALANTVNGTLSVQMQITASCTIGTSSLTFASTAGTSLLASQVTQTGSISVTCTNSNPYSIGLDNGANASSGQRRMANGSNYISYNLYTDSGHTYPWTTGATNSTCTTTSDCALGIGNGTAQTVSVYGVVPTVTVAPTSGTYSDNVTITVTY